MATIAFSPVRARRDDRFFLTMAFVMAATIVAGFSFQLAMGRSSFSEPPLVHAHAIVFMGWVVIYVAQNWFATMGPLRLHRVLGWIALGWIVAMFCLGTAVTVAMVREARTPFFFQPLHFLIFDPLTIIGFGGLILAGVALRRQTDWHRRLNYSAMSMLTGPALGRLLPMPFVIPYAYHATFAATLVFPLVGMIADVRRTGRVHPAWWLGAGRYVRDRAGDRPDHFLADRHGDLSLGRRRFAGRRTRAFGISSLAFGLIPALARAM